MNCERNEGVGFCPLFSQPLNLWCIWKQQGDFPSLEIYISCKEEKKMLWVHFQYISLQLEIENIECALAMNTSSIVLDLGTERI